MLFMKYWLTYTNVVVKRLLLSLYFWDSIVTVVIVSGFEQCFPIFGALFACNVFCRYWKCDYNRFFLIIRCIQRSVSLKNQWNPNKRRKLRKILSTSFTEVSFLFGGREYGAVLFTFSLKLNPFCFSFF